MSQSTSADRSFALPPLGGNPSTERQGTTPGSFANAGRVGTAYAYSSPDMPGMPGVSDFTAMNFARDLDREGKTQLEEARTGVVSAEMKRVALREPHLTPEQIRVEVAAGRMIVPANKVHLKYKLEPMAIGRAALTKVNANMGASPVSQRDRGRGREAAVGRAVGGRHRHGPLDRRRPGRSAARRSSAISTVPIGTVPIYSMIIGRSDRGPAPTTSSSRSWKSRRSRASITSRSTPGCCASICRIVRKRLIGIVSRGGSLLAKWMITHNKQNPMYEIFDDICDIMREYDVSFSLGDGLRPGGLADASDEAQLRELATLGELTERAWAKGVQVMVEGPGHVPFDQIEYNMKLQRKLCHGAPFYVLGPLVTDIFPGYDHITSCIGATAAGYHGASMLCYVTPKEHLGLPKKDDVKQGCVAYKIAAHAADVALGIPGSRDRDDELTKARAALNWQRHFDLSFDPDLARAYHDEDLEVDTDFCAMCGHDWCSVRISKEITDFYSGKDEAAQPAKKAVASPGVSAPGADILKQRGVLSPDEIHKLAHKGKKAVCHSDNVKDADEAKLVQVDTLKAHGVVVNESGL